MWCRRYLVAQYVGLLSVVVRRLIGLTVDEPLRQLGHVSVPPQPTLPACHTSTTSYAQLAVRVYLKIRLPTWMVLHPGVSHGGHIGRGRAAQPDHVDHVWDGRDRGRGERTGGHPARVPEERGRGSSQRHVEVQHGSSCWVWSHLAMAADSAFCSRSTLAHTPHRNRARASSRPWVKVQPPCTCGYTNTTATPEIVGLRRYTSRHCALGDKALRRTWLLNSHRRLLATAIL